jgi:hypothetical protein
MTREKNKEQREKEILKRRRKTRKKNNEWREEAIL